MSVDECRTSHELEDLCVNKTRQSLNLNVLDNFVEAVNFPRRRFVDRGGLGG